MIRHRTPPPRAHHGPQSHQAGPTAAEANGLMALYRSGQWDRLEAEARKAVARHPGHAFGWKMLGIALQAGRRLEGAVEALLRAAALAPRDADVQGNLGNAYRDLDRLPEAEGCYRRAIGLRPDHAGAYSNLGNVIKALGRPEEAEDCYRRAIGLRPDQAKAHNNLGNLLKDLDRPEEAEACYRRAIAIQPDIAEVHGNLGNVLQVLGRLEEAEACHRRAIAIAPGDAEAYLNLGNALFALGRHAEAEDSYRCALSIGPGHVEAHCRLGNLLLDRGRFPEAEASFRRAIAIRPDSAGAHAGLGNTLRHLGRMAESEADLRRALEIEPDRTEVRSTLLFSLNYRACTPEAYRAEALEYGSAVAAQVKARFTEWACPERPERLRVSLVSGDLCRHPVGYFLEGVLARLDPARIEVFAYSTVEEYERREREDDLTGRLRAHCSGWRSLAGLDDDAAARLIHADGVHVLVDLSGHSARNRLPVFARRPAPVQATWLGYSASTGLSEMDWLIGDRHVAPPEEDWQFTERVWRLPESYLCFTPPDVAVGVDPPPALSAGHVTFGSFNNLLKTNDAVVALWSRVLQAVPGSRLYLKTRQLSDETIRESLLGRFGDCGIAAERLLLEGEHPRREDHFAAYNRMDIALDPFPYTGTTTCVDGLWMGVPFVTRRGDRFLSHVGESIAHNAGLSEWIAIDDDDYVAKAAAFAADPDRLAALRAGLRPRVLASPLFDAPRFARHFEDALWGMWEGRGKVEG